MEQESLGIARDAGKILDAHKASDIILLDISTISSFADCFLIASGRSSPQVKALSDQVEDTFKKSGLFPRHIEGYAGGRWIILDYSPVIIHIFHEEDRAFYNIERLWTNDTGSNRIVLGGE
ncbi:MAG: ribosome silencing factor [Christensenellales bacterium]|jgi:ribosome-associated protein